MLRVCCPNSIKRIAPCLFNQNPFTMKAVFSCDLQCNMKMLQERTLLIVFPAQAYFPTEEICAKGAFVEGGVEAYQFPA